MPSDWLALLAEERSEELDSKLQEFTKPPKPVTSAQFQFTQVRDLIPEEKAGTRAQCAGEPISKANGQLRHIKESARHTGMSKHRPGTR